MQVADLSEAELIAQFVGVLPPGETTMIGPGDDAALLSQPDTRVLVSTDVLVQDRHFRLDWGTAADVGYRAAMQNLADIAAMGGRATAIVVALVLPSSTQVEWVVEFATGLAQACRPHRVGVVGGDLSSGDQLCVCVTVLGTLDSHAPVRRSGARPGDVVAHAGSLGWAAAGLAALRAGEGAPWPRATAAFLRPEPPLAAGAAAAMGGAHALIDVSDGLLTDAARIAQASGVSIDLDPAVLIDPDLEPIAQALDARVASWLLTGGEDHGLLAAFAPQTPLPPPFRRIGTVGRGPAGAVLVAGEPPPVPTTGWDHFRRTP
ncbi:MAG: thiamine-phosphate kinase [Beutenbergiaceae bacterium]